MKYVNWGEENRLDFKDASNTFSEKGKLSQDKENQGRKKKERDAVKLGKNANLARCEFSRRIRQPRRMI